METKIKIAIVDDHKLVSRALENMISTNPDFDVVMTCLNGDEFLTELSDSKVRPDVVLMDLKVIALTMEDNESTIIKMLNAGAKGYLLKDMSPENLFQAIHIVHEKGIFYTDLVTQSLLRVKSETKTEKFLMETLNVRELEFIKLACSELTYREIADKMFVSPRTIDGYRDSIFTKINVKTRVGIVLFAIRNELL